MNIRTKLIIGVGALCSLIVLLGVLGITQVRSLARASHSILEDNYVSLEYTGQMLQLLDEVHKDTTLVLDFGNVLIKQQNNISEIGEAELTLNLTRYFEKFQMNTNNLYFAQKIRNEINDIVALNMTAIKRKNILANEAANRAMIWIGLTGALCLGIAFFILIKLPSNIGNTISELTRSIKQISANNYSERVHFENHGEFGELAKSFNKMAEQLEEYNNSNLAKLMMEKRRIEALINNMQDPVIGLDESLKVIFANEEAIKIIGRSEHELIGHYAHELAVKNDLIRTLIQDLMAVEDAPSSVKPKPIKIFADNKEGYFEKETLHISIVPTGELQEVLIGHVIVLRNVTVYKELDFAKTNFIANVSHEFKTPISAIKMSVQLLENKQIGSLNEEQQNLLDSIKEDASRLLKITAELLNMTQVESGNIQLSVLPSDPKDMLMYAVNANKTQAEQKQIALEITCPDILPKVQADTEKTAWVLTNLISNAIHYSYDHSTIQLSIGAESGKVSIAVKDTGQGIAPQYKDKIFDRYFRVPGTRKDGTGLGLAISKEFIEAQGGTISVDSEFGAGSTFTVMLNGVT